MVKEQLDLATHLERPEASRNLVEQDKERAVMVLEPVDKVILAESEVLEHPDKELVVMVLEPMDKVILVESEVLEHPDKASDPVSEDLEDTVLEPRDPED